MEEDDVLLRPEGANGNDPVCEVEPSEEGSEEEWRFGTAKAKLLRYASGNWITFTVPESVLVDITNYPLSFREDLLKCVVAVSNKLHCSNDLKEHLTAAWDLVESQQTVVVSPSSVLPRFLWYRYELDKLFGADRARESAPQQGAPSAVLTNEEALEEPIQEEPECTLESNDIAVAPPEFEQQDNEEIIGSGGSSTLVVRTKKKKRLTTVVSNSSLLQTFLNIFIKDVFECADFNG